MTLLEQGDGSGFSLREAARAVGVTVNASYRHFASKDALMSAIAAEGFRRFALMLEQGARSGSDAHSRLFGAGRAYVRFARQHPALFRLMFSRFSAVQKNAELSEAAQRAYQPLRTGMAALLDRPADSAEVTLATLRAWSMAHGLAWLLLDGQLDHHDTDSEALIDNVLSGWPAPATSAR